MNLSNQNKNQKRVVIIGAGFAGIKLARKLSEKEFQVILVDKNNYHQFQPLLYQVATGGLEPSSISFPLRKIFKSYDNVSVRLSEVLEIKPEIQTIETTSGNITYDILVLAQGATTNFFNNKNIQANAYSMKSVSESLFLRNTLLENYEKATTTDISIRKSLLNVVIVGGGPTGVELAGTIAEMRNKTLPKDYPELNFGQMQVYLIEASSKLLSAMTDSSSVKVVEYLKNMGVQVITNQAVKNYDGEIALLNDDTELKTKCLIWAAGVKGLSIPGIPSSAVALNERVFVNEFNEVRGLSNAFAIGDIALMETLAYPKGHPQVAPVAMQQAELLAINLLAKEHNKPMTAFVYHNKGTMATVGKNKAVVEVGKIKVHGYFAWAVWMFVHLMSIIGIKNRIFILLNWMWHYFSYDSSLRLIIKPKVQFNQNQNNSTKKIVV